MKRFKPLISFHFKDSNSLILSMAEARSRLLTILGGIHLALGLYISASVFFNLPSTWRIVEWSRTYSMPAYYWSMGEALLLGALSVGSGGLLLRRAAWAPLFAAAVGATILFDAVHALYLFAEMNWRLMVHTAREQKYLRITAHYAAMNTLEVVRGVSWLVTLGTLYREKTRAEFPPSRPEATTRNLWTAFVLSLVVSGLIQGWIEVLGWLGWSDRP